MKIKAKTKFLHGRARMEQGKYYEVPEGLGTYFVMMGWAETSDNDVKPEVISKEKFETDAPAKREGEDLEVQNAKLGQKGSTHG